MGSMNALITPQGPGEQHPPENVTSPVTVYVDRSAYFPEWLGRWPASL
jgi:hypothetical protein